jgi:methyl-accepting chemotaxis protein
MRWKNVSIQKKILVIGGSVIAGFVAVMVFYVVPVIERSIYDLKKEKIKDMVDATVTTIEGMHRERGAGAEAEERFRKNAIEYVRKIRYGPAGKDYLWINDFHPRMVMHPLRSDLDGQDVTDYKDPTGHRLFVAMVETCRSDGAGYVSYVWQYGEDKNRLEPKISYVRQIPGTGWIVGTGVYEIDIRTEIAGRLRTLRIELAAVFAAITGVMFLLVYLVSRGIRNAIARCVDFADKLAAGNLAERIDLVQHDEIGVLASRLNASADNLEKLVGEVVANAHRLDGVIHQIAGGNKQLSQMNSEQAAALEEIAASIEEAVSSISGNADQAMAADEMSRAAADTAERGSEVVNSAIDAIGSVSGSGKRIVEITALINEIAFQTNLLALNAAVEAARAGEAGRGFAVVAGEVRNLARRAGEAARQIETVIGESMRSIESAAAQGERSREALQNILESISRVNAMVREIASASHEQKRAIEQINTAVLEVDKVTQNNSSLVEETATISTEMSRQAGEMRELTGRFTVSRRAH